MRKLSAVFLFATFSVCLEAQLPVPLGTAGTFGVLAGSAVTNTGVTAVTGNLGVSPGTAVSGFPPGTVTGSIFTGASSAAGTAQADLTTAYNNALGRTGATILPADIGGSVRFPGVYHTNAGDSLAITGTLTLNGNGNCNSVFIFQIGSTLTATSGSTVVLTNGANAANIFWQVGSSATLVTGSTFYGTILAQASISAQAGSVLN